jgi:hypothetical protein
MHSGSWSNIKDMCTHPFPLCVPFFRCAAIGCIMMGTVSSVCAQSAAKATEDWKKNLEQKGIIDRSLPAPYRVALPLASFGDKGPKIMFTYAPSTKAPLVFIKLELN